MTRGSEDIIPSGGRRLPIVVWVVLVVVYLAIIQVVTKVMTADAPVKYAAPTTLDEVLKGYLVPIGLSALFAAGVVTYLRWWRPAMVEHRPVQRWVIAVPILMVLGIVTMIDYGALAAKGVAFTAALLLTMMCVGFAEEMMFRGVGLTMFRAHGFTEGRAALWSTVAFGIAHATNLFTAGTGAFFQVLTTIIAGYFFYLIRRRAGTLLVGMLVHGLWDFSLISTSVATGTSGIRGGIGILVMIVLFIVVLARRKKIEPVDATAAAH